MSTCLVCGSGIEYSWFDPQAFCDACIKDNKEKFDFTKETEQFTKELRALFYHDIGDSWAIHPDEARFVMIRWGIWKEESPNQNSGMQK